MHRPLLILLFCTFPAWSFAQIFTFDGNVAVQSDGAVLPMAWAGGLNFPQVSPIDLDQDGLMDLFLFDRSGNKALFFLNAGSAGEVHYVPSHAYDDVYPFPLLHDWALLRDYNCDGKMDIFAYTSAGFAVYKNTSDVNGLSFTLFDDLVGSNYVPNISPNLYVTNVDIPGIADIDGDGDLDVLTFSIWGPDYLEYHKNLSMEQYGTCDSLVFEVRSRCWGEFIESVNDNSVILQSPCDYNVPNPEMPRPGPDGITRPLAADRQHTGSTILPLDLDGDQVMDLILGDFLSPDLVALTNGGAVSHAEMTAVDTLFPQYDVQAYFDQFLAAYHVDVDNDGKRDLVVAPNSPAGSENAHSMWYYLNTNTDNAPHFEFQQDDLFQASMLDFGEGAYPVLFDHNGDGLMDLIVANQGYYQTGGTYLGRLALLENTGTSTSPSFTLVTDNYMGLDGYGFGPGMYPAFGDLDGDGHPDMIIGDGLGQLHRFHNSSTGSTAQFELAEPLMTDANSTVIDVGYNATPQLYDVDGDGLLDLLIGERNGNINLYLNTGTEQVAAWQPTNENLGEVSVNEYWNTTGYSVPFLYTNESGEQEFLSGSQIGGLHHYDGIDGNMEGEWNLTDSIWLGFQEGMRTAVVLYDFTGDGRLDAVIGNYRGGLSFWKEDTFAGISHSGRDMNIADFTLSPNPALSSVEILLHMPWSPGMHVDVMDGLGRIVMSKAITGGSDFLEVNGLPAGVYAIRLSSGRLQQVQRLVVAH